MQPSTDASEPRPAPFEDFFDDGYDEQYDNKVKSINNTFLDPKNIHHISSVGINVTPSFRIELRRGELSHESARSSVETARGNGFQQGGQRGHAARLPSGELQKKILKTCTG